MSEQKRICNCMGADGIYAQSTHAVAGSSLRHCDLCGLPMPGQREKSKPEPERQRGGEHG